MSNKNELKLQITQKTTAAIGIFFLVFKAFNETHTQKKYLIHIHISYMSNTLMEMLYFLDGKELQNYTHMAAFHQCNKCRLILTCS